MSSNSELRRKLAQDDFLLNVAAGKIPGYDELAKFGRNDDISTASAPEDLWPNGGLYTGQPLHSAAAETVEVFSSDAADSSPAGAGARLVQLEGLDENWNYQVVAVALNGVTAVPTTELWHRVFRVGVLTGGTPGGDANTGTITVRHTTTTANVFAIIPPGHGQTTQAVYTVPGDKRLFLRSMNVQMARANGANGAAVYSMKARAEGSVYRAILYNDITTGYQPLYEIGIMIDPKVDLVVRCEETTDNNSSIAAAFYGTLIDI